MTGIKQANNLNPVTFGFVSWTKTRPNIMYNMMQYIRVCQGILYIQNVTFTKEA